MCRAAGVATGRRPGANGCCAQRIAATAVGLWLAIMAAAECQGQEDYAPLADMQEAQAVHLLVELNGRDTGALVRFMLRDGELYARQADLQTIGIDTASLQLIDPVIPLTAIAGLRYRYTEHRQAVAIELPPHLRTASRLGAGGAGPGMAATSDRGLTLNYDAYFQQARSHGLALGNELRYFDARGVLETTGTAYFGDTDRQGRYIRYDTFWTHSDPARLFTVRVGDTISSGLDWTRPVRMAGIQAGKDYSLRPDLVTYPLPQLGGMAVVPSAVDLYINNLRRTRAEVPEGPFFFNEMPGITGAGDATIITRDALGRAIATTLPIYIDRRMVAPGMASYSVEAGFLRRRYALASFAYDSRPAFSATVRHGLSDTLTTEGHAEAMPGIYNAGAGALIRLGTQGVVNAALSLSAGAGRRVALGYQAIRQRYALDLQTTRDYGDYRDLGASDGFPGPRRTDRATLSFPLGQRQSLAISYIGYQLDGYGPSRVTSVGHTIALGARISAQLSGYRSSGASRDRGVFLSVSLSLDGGTYVGASAGRRAGESSYNVTANRAPAYAGGWGWGLQSGQAQGMRWNQAQASYRGRYGEATVLAQDIGGRSGAALNATGGIVVMDGGVQFSRRVGQGFALVSTDGIPNVPVMHENRAIGTTDGKGHLLVPDLNAYQRNRISIDGVALPANVNVPVDHVTVAPRANSGVVARFAISRYHAASVILHDRAGEPLPVGAEVVHVESGARTVTGYDGLTFIDQLQAQNHLEVSVAGGRCAVQFAYEAAASAQLPTIGPLTCDAGTHP